MSRTSGSILGFGFKFRFRVRVRYKFRVQVQVHNLIDFGVLRYPRN